MIRPTGCFDSILRIIVSAVVPAVIVYAVLGVVVADPLSPPATPMRNGNVRASVEDQRYEKPSKERSPREQPATAPYDLMDDTRQSINLMDEYESLELQHWQSSESLGPSSAVEVEVAEYEEVEILLTERLNIDDVRALPQAPGGIFEELSEPPRVLAQLPLGTVKALTMSGASLQVRHRFQLLTATYADEDDLAGIAPAGSCSGTFREGANNSNVNIPDNNSWVFSAIAISGAPAGATDVH